MIVDVEKHTTYIEAQIKDLLEVRGFLITECRECPLRDEILGGYDRDEVRGYTCRFTIGRINEKEVPFPKSCKLVKVSEMWREMITRDRKMMETAERIVELGRGRV